MASNGDDLGTVLGVWAHPDDETWLSAGLMARAVDQGRRVVCVTATRGEAGFPADDTRPTGRTDRDPRGGAGRRAWLRWG